MGAHDYPDYNIGGGAGYRVSDLWVVETGSAPNNGFLYPAVISPLLPAADVVGESDFTPSTGSDNYATVNDAGGQNFDTDFNESDTATHKDRFTSSGGLPQSPAGSYLAVQTVSMVRDVADLGTRTARAVIYEGTTEGVGATATLTEPGYQPVEAIFETNPDTATTWTAAEIEAAEFGIELVS